jgi:hypothetical protein
VIRPILGALGVFTFNEGTLCLDFFRVFQDKMGMVEVPRAANEDLFYPIPGTLGGKAKANNEICYTDDQGGSSLRDRHSTTK